MAQQIDPALKQALLTAEFRAAITLWNRLEGRARKEDFDRSLRAEVRDPLWLLTRQWQFGEFKGEDAGSAVKARVQLDTSKIDRYAVKSEVRDASGGEKFNEAVPYDQSFPLEILVEREPVLPAGPEPNTEDLALRAQMGRHWLRLLKAAGVAANVRATLVQRFGFDDISENQNPASNKEKLEKAHLESDPVAWQTLRAVKQRLPDGRKLLRAMRSNEFDLFVDGQFGSDVAQRLKNLAKDFLAWFERLFSQPQTNIEDAWAPSYLEYQFAVSAPAEASGETRSTLVAEQYYQGTLDWYAFDVDAQRSLVDLPENQFPKNSFEKRPPVAFLPSQIEFNGMPNVRWWEFEDRRTDFGNINATTADVPLLLLAEFGLVYGNDWTVIPYNLEVGTLADINGIIVSDVFGVQTLIRPAGQGQQMDWQRWSMYNLRSNAAVDSVDSRLFVPPSVAKVYESNPIEKVILARDEMANLVWGVEDTIPGVTGAGVNGFETAKAISNYFLSRAEGGLIERQPNDAKISYVLGTTVPENWIPFIARHKPGSNRQIRLQRAAMPRLTDLVPGTAVEPRGKILRDGLDTDREDKTYFVHEEEVPRAGAILTRKFQRARGPNGEVFTWIGRRKQTGRGEGASGLAFDQVVPVKQTNRG